MDSQVLLIYETKTGFDSQEFVQSTLAMNAVFEPKLSFSCQEISDAGDWSIKDVSQANADIVLFYLFAHNEEYLFAVSALTQHIDIPVIIISQQDTPGLAAKTIHSGITSYGIDELKSDRFHSIIEVGFSRYELIRSIKTDLNSTKNKLEERKLIAKAKGIVMLQKQLSEDEAYVSLRKSAMNQGVTMAELSKKIISVFQTLE